MSTVSKKKGIDTPVLIVAVIGSLILLNLIGARFFRADLTRSQMYTLNQATAKMLKGLKDPVTVRAYITRDLPPPWSATASYVKDLLDEYYARSGGNFRYEVIDPASEETEADKQKKKDLKQDVFGRLMRDKTSVEQELDSLGIVSFPAGRIDADTKEVKRAYMGLVVVYGDKKEVIPQVETDPRGIEHAKNLEYDLTTLIRKVSRERAPKLALIIGHENPDLTQREEPQMNSMGYVYNLLQKEYQVTTIDLTKKSTIDDDVDAILVVGPRTPFSEPEKRAIDQFVTSGRAAAFFLGPVAPELQTGQANPTEHGLNDLLASYGVKLEPGLVLDTEAGSIMLTQQSGGMRITQQVPYPFILVRRSLNPEQPLTRGLTGVVLPFMGPLQLQSESREGFRAEVLVQSSPHSWIHLPPYNLDPSKRWTRDEVGEMSPQNLLVSLSGALPSHFSSEQQEPDAKESAKAEKARVLVAAGHGFMLDQFMSRSNQALVLNIMDWLAMDEALLAIRSRGLQTDLLDKDLSDGTRNLVKYLNIVGLPLAFIGVGLVRWRRRESRRGKVKL